MQHHDRNRTTRLLSRTLLLIGAFAGIAGAHAQILTQTLLEDWDARSLVNAINPNTGLAFTNTDTVDNWTGANGRVATATTNHTFFQQSPYFLTNATPAGGPVLFYSNALSRIDDSLIAPALVYQRTNFSVAYVFNVYTNQPPKVNGSENWFTENNIVDGEMPGTQYDWGTAIRTDGQWTFGTGGVANKTDDRSTKSFGANLIDGQYHVVVGTWGQGIVNVYVDGRPVVTSTFLTAAPRRLNASTDPNNTALDQPGNITFGGVQTDAGSGGRRFRGNLAEVQFYGTNLPPDAVANLIASLSAKHGLGVNFSTLAIRNFSPSQPTIAPGAAGLLTWNVAGTRPATRYLLYSSISAYGPDGTPLDVTANTLNGVGSVVVAPANDTLYQLVVTNADTSQFSTYAYATLAVARTAAASLVDRWVLPNGFSDANPDYYWTSLNGRTATWNGTASPAFTNTMTANGLPAAYFTQTKLVVPASGSLAGGLNAFTVACVLQQDPLNPPTANNAIWRSDAGFYDTVSGVGPNALERSWGCATKLAPTGLTEVTFGFRNPGVSNYLASAPNFDETVTTVNSGLSDGNFHVVVCKFGAGSAQIYVDGQPKVVSVGPPFSTDPRDASAAALGALQNATGLAQFFHGSMAELRFYNANLSDYEVQGVIHDLGATYAVPVSFAQPAPFSITSTLLQAGKLTLIWQTIPGSTYHVQSRSSLNGGTWTTLATVNATQMSTIYMDPAPVAGTKFYRVTQ